MEQIKAYKSLNDVITDDFERALAMDLSTVLTEEHPMTSLLDIVRNRELVIQILSQTERVG